MTQLQEGYALLFIANSTYFNISVPSLEIANANTICTHLTKCQDVLTKFGDQSSIRFSGIGYTEYDLNTGDYQSFNSEGTYTSTIRDSNSIYTLYKDTQNG